MTIEELIAELIKHLPELLRAHQEVGEKLMEEWLG